MFHAEEIASVWRVLETYKFRKSQCNWGLDRLHETKWAHQPNHIKPYRPNKSLHLILKSLLVLSNLWRPVIRLNPIPKYWIIRVIKRKKFRSGKGLFFLKYICIVWSKRSSNHPLSWKPCKLSSWQILMNCHGKWQLKKPSKHLGIWHWYMKLQFQLYSYAL